MAKSNHRRQTLNCARRTVENYVSGFLCGSGCSALSPKPRIESIFVEHLYIQRSLCPAHIPFASSVPLVFLSETALCLRHAASVPSLFHFSALLLSPAHQVFFLVRRRFGSLLHNKGIKRPRNVRAESCVTSVCVCVRRVNFGQVLY